MYHIVKQWHFREGPSDHLQVPVILGVDAPTLEPDDKTRVIEFIICRNGHLFFWCKLIQKISNFSAHIRFLASGSPDKQSTAICADVTRELQECGLNVLALANDGERTCLARHEAAFGHYHHRLSEPIYEIAKVIGQVQHWEIADPLHVLSCQRCRLRDPLSFSGLIDSFFKF
jgi:hypothetical protein